MDCSCGNNPKDEEMNSILEKYSKDKSNLIQILNEVQENYGYIPKYSQISISEYLDIPLAEIYGVITFYARFTLKPKGKYNIAVCLGTACFVKGSEKVLDKAKEILKEVYHALEEKGYNPINQIVGYILSGDPTYITSHNDARNLIRQIERDELLEKMVKNYIGLEE